MKDVTLAIKPLFTDPTKPMTQLPAYACENDAGMDCYAYMEGTTVVLNGKHQDGYSQQGVYSESPATVQLNPGDIIRIQLGWACRVPVGYGMFLLPRSGLGSKQLIIPNAPGLIDHGYSNGVEVLLQNEGRQPMFIHHGMRVCQMLLLELPKVNLEVYLYPQHLPAAESNRNGGFGHTGEQ